MQDTIQRPKLNLKWMDAPIESDKWRNLYFLKDGSSDFGDLIHPSEKKAWEAINKFEKSEKLFIWWRGSKVLRFKYSHAFPVPVKE